MQKFTYKKNKKIGNISIKGELTIQYCSEMKNMILKAFKETDKVILNLSGLTDIDTPGLQLLYSAYKFSMDSKNFFGIKGECPQILQKIANDTGYLKDNETSKNSFWLRSES